MNQEILNQILPVVEKTKEGILKGIEIAQEQIPDLINQLLHWHLAKNCLELLFSLVVLIIFLACCKWANIEYKKDPSMEGLGGIFSIVFSALSGIVAFIGVVTAPSSIFVIAQIIVAPKLFLLEYITKLIK